MLTRSIITAAVAVLLIVLTIPAVRHWQERPPLPPPPPPVPPPMRGAWVPADGLEVGAGGDYPFGLALAADGRRLVYPAAKAGLVQLWLEDLATGERGALADTEGAAAPFWSADATRIAFFANTKVRVVDVRSGSVSELFGVPEYRGASWNAAGDIVFATVATGPLQRRSVDGTIAPLTSVDKAAGELGHAWPAFLADGKHVAFLVTANDRARAGIWVTSLDDAAARRRVASSDSQPVIAGDRMLYLNSNTLMAQPIDPSAHPSRAETIGLPVGRGPLAQAFLTAASDTIIYGPPGPSRRSLRWFSRDGAELETLAEPLDAWDFRIAPDGRRVAVTELDPQLRTLDVFVRERGQPAPRRISPSTDSDESGVWSPDGVRIAWASSRRHVMTRGAGGLLPEQSLATVAPPVQVWDWSRDGRALLIGRSDAQTGADLWTLQTDKEAATAIATAAAFNQMYGVFAPDMRSIAYASDESGQLDVYIDTYPKAGSRVRVTTAGGSEPRWRHDGGELYFRRGREVFAVEVRGSAGKLEIGPEIRLFDAGASIRAYDVTPDGRRFLVNIPAAGSAARMFTLVVNWQSALRP